MPPTPFQPSHSTPFKSTLSSSVQPAHLHTPYTGATASSSAAGTDAPLKLSELDARDWSYHAEGGLNLLLRYTPFNGTAKGKGPGGRWQGKALRLVKVPRASSAPDSQPNGNMSGTSGNDEEKEEEEGEQFRREVVLPLLCGDGALLPHSTPIKVEDARDRAVLETLAARIEIHRPRERRQKDGINTEAHKVWMIDDLCSTSIAEEQVLTVEIKPKWGYLPSSSSLSSISSPNVELKTRHSRFRMHKVARHPDPSSLAHAEFEGHYDPLDLYSCQTDRMQKALDALAADWQQSGGTTNNLRLFWNGEVVKPTQTAELDEIKAYLSAGTSSASSSDDLATLLASHLISPLAAPRLQSTSDRAESVLSRLSHLQSALDPRDIEGLAADWQRLVSAPLGTVPADATPEQAQLLLPPTVVEVAAAIGDPSQPVDAAAPPPSAPTTIAELRRATLRFLVASTFKDCSIMLRIVQPRGVDTADVDAGPASREVEIKLIDLDMKPIGKLAKFLQTDEEVIEKFRAWWATIGEGHSRES
ncbi:uncharacterized protein PFL1_01797 [Pseudozyma flocculosa PF-1]|uniref:Inositol-pentakisphosphate 2-kinase n=1 Tax=Pseudozyma flocculosa TaxID=84751 RepID=A0A5C3EXW1_9BASI|nr:uncharacterized protein PFL1_01797 [Pseudozyma flocculosa PF-1]EPQ30899.1 hypothetical protein PFL1_01797 [Pseudozyma flocculosa PF-1]SPO36720.1 related to Inositol-pentakisphosphate 2-kinase [Pseudozyma flocculosa]